MRKRDKAFHGRAWLATLTRAGYAARGLVFLIVGGFAGLAAVGAPTRALDSKDALRVLLGEPFGQVLLAVVAAGLFCFALWRFGQAFLDADSLGRDFNALARRAVFAGAGAFYLTFGTVAVSMIFGADRGGNSDELAHDWTVWLLGKPFGPWIVGIAGLSIAIAGIGMGLNGMRGELEHWQRLKPAERKAFAWLRSIGMLARAFVIVMIGLFLVLAAVTSHASRAKGFGGVLRIVQQQQFGPVLLGLTALGLIAFGCYGFAEARYRRIDIPKVASRGSR